MTGEILLIGDTFSYNAVPLEHTGGSSPLSESGQDFVFVNGKKVVCINTTHGSGCAMGCSMTITDTTNNFVYINSVLAARNPSTGSMSPHSTTVVSETQNNMVYII